MNVAAHKTLRIHKALVLGLTIAAVAVPIAGADAVDRGIVAPRATGGMQALDPLVADAIRAEQASPDLDPLVADAIRHGQPDFWNYDPRTGKQTSNSSPGFRAGDLAKVYSPTGDVSPDRPALDVRTPSSSPNLVSPSRDSGFQWDDAGIGAGAMLALVVIGAVVGTVLIRRRHDLLVSH